MSIDAKELKNAAERFAKNPEYHKKRIENLLELWEKEDRVKRK